jgi:plasmid stabilization system protein ParE
VHAVIWSPAAVAQLRAIRVYLEQFNPRAAGEVAAHLLSVGNGLESFPHRGRPVSGTEMREVVANPVPPHAGWCRSHSARPSHLTPADESLTRLADIGACVAPMDAATFRARARPIHRRSQALLEDAIAATANARVKPEGRGAWAGRSDSECVRFRWVGSADTRSIPAFARCE